MVARSVGILARLEALPYQSGSKELALPLSSSQLPIPGKLLALLWSSVPPQPQQPIPTLYTSKPDDGRLVSPVGSPWSGLHSEYQELVPLEKGPAGTLDSVLTRLKFTFKQP